MTKEEISNLMNMPFSKLCEICGAVTKEQKDSLANLISVSANMGINMEWDRVHKFYNRMFRQYNEITITN